MARLLSGIMVSRGQGNPPEAGLALRRHVVCSWRWGVRVVCIKAYIYMTKVTHFSLLHIFDGLQEDEERRISVGTSEASASLPVQDVHENGEWIFFVPIYGLKHCGKPSRQ